MKNHSYSLNNVFTRALAYLCLLLVLTSCGLSNDLELVEDTDSLDELAITVGFNRRYGTTINDTVTGIAADASGNSYISGNSEFYSGTSSTRAGFLSKYDAAGTFLWRIEKLNALINGVTLDKNGNGYAVGSFTTGAWPSERDYIFLEKYDTSGNTTWLRQFTVPVTSDRTYLISNAIATDPRGNNFIVILFEKNVYPYQTRQVFVRKYNVSGGLVWEKSVGNSSSYRPRPSLATDTKGNIYVANNLHLSLSWNAVINQLDAQGNYGWQTTLYPVGSASTKLTYIHNITADLAGNVFVTGITQGNLEGTNLGSYDAFIRKLDTTGTAVWTRQFGTSATDYANGLTTDSAGSIYVAGSTTGNLRGVNRGSYDAYVLKYSTNGDILRTNQFGTSAFDIANTVKTDVSGNLYVGGNTEGQFAGLPKGGSDVYFRKYSLFE